jgi:glycine oxidase
MLAPWNEAPEAGPLLELAVRGLDVYDRFVGRLAQDTAPFLYARNGTLDVALQDADALRLQQLGDAHGAAGVPCEWLERSALLRIEPALSPSVRGGLLFPSQGFVGATDLTRALVAGARRHGARFVQHGRVLRVCRRGDETQVITERGALTTDLVVLAAGSWSGRIEIEGAEPAPVQPVRGQLLHLSWRGKPPSRVIWSERCYAIPWPDGTVLTGATVENVGFDESTTVAGVRGLLGAICELLPAARDAAFLSARAGLRPSTPDHLPIIGRSSSMPNVFYATGHYRNGVLMAPLTAELVADQILDERIDPLLAVTTPSRFGRL